MNQVALIDPVQDPRWDKFVMNHPFGWICHLSGWKQVLENSFKHMKGYYFALMDETGENIQSALPVFEVKSWLTGKRLVSIPYATLCDPLISSSEDMRVLLESVHNLFNKVGSKYIEIRALNSPSLIQDDIGLCQKKIHTHHFFSLENNLDSIIKTFHRTCVRKNIKRALRSNLNIHVVKDIQQLNIFYRLYVMTRKDHGLPPIPLKFFMSIWDNFSASNRVTFMIAENKKQAVASIMIFKFKNRVSAEHLGWDRSFNSIRPGTYIYWEAIKLAHSEGYKIFDFGVTSTNNIDLMEYKRRWGTKIVEIPQYYYPANMRKKDNDREESIKYKIFNILSKRAPDRAFKLLGAFCYRHLG